MTAPRGSHLGPYEILDPLGAGAMGEVYRARDTRLDRIVAIKILPPSRGGGRPGNTPAVRAEARTISQISHPHICPLHDVGRQEGVDYLVFEHLERETLAHRISRGFTNAIWDREYQVLQENPALIVAHRSSFYDTTLFDPAANSDVGHTEQVKLNGSYPLPGGFMVSGVYQNISGPQITASYAPSNAAIAPSLGRNLAVCGTRLPCTATATVPLIAPGTMSEGRISRLDMRLTKFVALTSRLRLQGNLDLYNAFNSSSILDDRDRVQAHLGRCAMRAPWSRPCRSARTCRPHPPWSRDIRRQTEPDPHAPD